MLNFFRPGAKGLDRSGPRLTEPGPGVNPNGFKARGVPLKTGHRGVGHSQWNVFEFYSGATQANFKAPRLSNFRQGFEKKNITLTTEPKPFEQRLVKDENHGEVWIGNKGRVATTQRFSGKPDRFGYTFIPDARGTKKINGLRRRDTFEVR